MIKLPDILQEAISYLSRFPGIGEKTATRHVLALSSWVKSDLQGLSEAISNIADLQRCQECGMFSDVTVCSTCSNHERISTKSLCVVEGVTDAMAIERSGNYKGLLHLLGGVLNPLSGVGPEELTLYKLFSRIEELGIEELILAINPSIEGDATCSYIKQEIENLKLQVKIERIGFGMPIGGSLEYLDPLTITKALENRRIL